MRDDEFDAFLVELRQRRIDEAKARRRPSFLVRSWERAADLVAWVLPAVIIGTAAVAFVELIVTIVYGESVRDFGGLFNAR